MLSPSTRQSKHFSTLLSALLVLVCCCLASIARAAEPQGVLEIQIKDHRDAIGDFAKLNITIDKILLSPNAGLKFWQTGWKEFSPETATIDLTQYIGKKTARVLRRSIDPGSFEAFHVKLRNIDGVLKTKSRSVPVKDTVGAVQLPFQVPAKGETILVIDLTVVDLSDHPPRSYELGIRGYELYTNGKLVGKVPPG